MTVTNNQFENVMFGPRIANIIETKGISKAWIAQQLGISKQALNYLLKHALKPKFVEEFAQLLEIDSKWLETGVGNPTPTTQKQANKIPILKNESFLHTASYDPSAQEFIEVSGHDAKSVIAYRLLDDSNFPPLMPDSILIFDLEKKVRDGNYVLVQIDSEVMVRQYVVDGNNICFKASSVAHKTYINPSAKIIGVLLEARYLLS